MGIEVNFVLGVAYRGLAYRFRMSNLMFQCCVESRMEVLQF